MEPDIKIDRIKIEGFKSIKSLDLELRNINILIGANGSGKSNLVSFFKMLNYISSEGLQDFVKKSGGAHALLHFGQKVTQTISSLIVFEKGMTQDKYEFDLSFAPQDTLFFSKETFSFRDNKQIDLEKNHYESKIPVKTHAKEGPSPFYYLLITLNNCRYYQFHDTSDLSNIKNKSKISQKNFLFHDAGNLSAYLYMLKEKSNTNYRKIIEIIKRVEPSFHDFYLEPDEFDNIMLSWRCNTDLEYTFEANQISDGLLRFMALTTLLMQPIDRLPKIIIIDEPELGLHPFALNLLVGMIKKVSNYSQIILATQSARIVDQFEPEDVIVVEKQNDKSVFCRQNSENLKEWLEDYKMGQLWEKNVIGGRPSYD